MNNFDFLRIGDDVLSIQEVMTYLKDSGNFGQLVSTVLREYLVDKELQSRDFQVSDSEIEQFILDFRLQNNGVDRPAFERWLSEQNLSYESFREKAIKGIKFQKLREQVAGVKVDQFFEENHSLFDRLALSRIVVQEAGLAQKVSETLQQDSKQFNYLVAEYSISEDRHLDGRMGVFPREEMPPQLQAGFNEKSAGSIIGPIVVEDLHCFFRLDQLIEAKLDDSLRRTIEDKLFEEWLRSKMQGLNLQMLV
ncbi:SurA N-terminal domain-containing protein [Phormidium yuhuli AB48]|uniref:peptidylprolyl isomerase n=1 Tax=Phormidium yuhuli AB48 TaxID=2940671 RepID=A0ABY5AQA8_9CYAN|nr:SurA N-terminal domain-containing protein [Phormidium yuhuli]USR91412.1 SurA N-terminal domain-containing protein [Phormidium yuhuli AB48]